MARDPVLERGLAYLKVGTPDFGQMVQRILRIKGTVPDLTDPRYNLGFTIEDATRPEFWWSRKGVRGAGGVNVLAVAAQQSFVSFTVAQRKLVIIESIRIGVTAATGVTAGFGALPAAGTTTVPMGADDRVFSPSFSPGSSLSVVGGTSAAPTAILNPQWYNLFANQSMDLLCPIILTGLINYNIILSTANLSLTMAYTFRERELYPEEF